MSTYKHKLPSPKQEHETTTWEYWVSRDSLDGAVSAECSLWHEKPLRTRIGTRVTWTSVYGWLGNFRPDEVKLWFRTCPETDMELLHVETRPNKDELAESKAKHK